MELSTVLVVDDHPMVRRGVATVLDSQPDIRVVGEASDGLEALEQARRLRPDVVLMDLQMPRMDGVEAITCLRNELPEIRVIILTTFETDEHIFRGLEAGAQSYLLKDASSEELVEAVRSVRRGESPLEPRVASRVLERLKTPVQNGADSETLSAREVEVLEVVAKGSSNKEIAAQLFISENTVKAHLYHIFEKLEVRGRTEAVAEAARRGIIGL